MTITPPKKDLGMFYIRLSEFMKVTPELRTQLRAMTRKERMALLAQARRAKKKGKK